MSFGIISHPRSGTNLLMWYVFNSFDTGRSNYRELFLRHISGDHDYAHRDVMLQITRSPKDVLVSYYRVRSVMGLGNISFSDYIRTDYADMPRITCDPQEVRMNYPYSIPSIWEGNWGKELHENPVSYLRRVVRYQTRISNVRTTYAELIDDPEKVMHTVAHHVPWKMTNPNFRESRQVGWVPPIGKPKVTVNDLMFIESNYGRNS